MAKETEQEEFKFVLQQNHFHYSGKYEIHTVAGKKKMNRVTGTYSFIYLFITPASFFNQPEMRYNIVQDYFGLQW